LRVAAQDVSRSDTKSTDDLEAKIFELLPVGQPLLTACQTLVPVADRVEGHAEPPQCPSRPPAVAVPLERRESLRPCRDRALEVAGEDADVGQRALGERTVFLEPCGIRDLERATRVGNRHLGWTTRQAVQEARPAVPRGPTLRIGDRLDRRPDPLQ